MFHYNLRRLAVLFGMFAVTGPVSAAPLFSDNFNAQNGGVGALNFNSFSGWTVSNGTVDLIGNGFFDFYPGHGLYVDLDGSTNQAGKLSTTMSFTPGTYQLTFSLGGSQRGDTNVVTVSLGNFSDVLTRNSSDPLAPVTLTFTTTTAGVLSFQNAGGDNMGAILDDVSITAIPEPATLAVFGLLGAGGLGYVRRRLKASPAA